MTDKIYCLSVRAQRILPIQLQRYLQSNHVTGILRLNAFGVVRQFVRYPRLVRFSRIIDSRTFFYRKSNRTDI